MPAAKALYLLLKGTYLVNRDQVGAMLGDAAASAKRRANRDPKGFEIVAALGPLLDYVQEPAKKAIATKVKEGLIKPKPPKTPKAKAAPAPTPAAEPPQPALPKAPGQ